MLSRSSGKLRCADEQKQVLIRRKNYAKKNIYRFRDPFIFYG